MVTQLAQCRGFDLADALAGKRERQAHFPERVCATIVQTKTHPDDLFLGGFSAIHVVRIQAAALIDTGRKKR
jgi:hypothetical protein